MKIARIVLTIFALIVASLALVPTDALALAKSHCKFVYSAPIDPIVNRGGIAAHDHSFLGAHIEQAADPTRVNWTQLQSLPTTCSSPSTGNHSSYWYPSLYQNGVKINPFAEIGYYTCFQGRTSVVCGTSNKYVQAYPHDLRMVAGNANATAPQATNIVNWVCRQSDQTPLGPYSTPAAANCETRDPNNTGLALHVEFPSCWDGVLANHTVDGNTADADGVGPQTDHVIYPVNYPSKTAYCPASHPRRLSHLQLDVAFRCGSTTSWACESDNITLSSAWATGRASQNTLHGDFLMGWSDLAQTNNLLACINRATEGGHPDPCGS